MSCRKSVAHFFLCLERQVISCTLSSRLLCRGEWCRGCIRSGRCCCLLRRERCSGGYGACHLTADNVVGTNIVEPTSVVFTGINIKLNRDFLARLNIKLLDTILAKDVEQHLSGILTRNLNHVFLSHPWVTSAC